jgi:hypothetical protein
VISNPGGKPEEEKDEDDRIMTRLVQHFYNIKSEHYTSMYSIVLCTTVALEHEIKSETHTI